MDEDAAEEAEAALVVEAAWPEITDSAAAAPCKAPVQALASTQEEEVRPLEVNMVVSLFSQVSEAPALVTNKPQETRGGNLALRTIHYHPYYPPYFSHRCYSQAASDMPLPRFSRLHLWTEHNNM